MFIKMSFIKNLETQRGMMIQTGFMPPYVSRVVTNDIGSNGHEMILTQASIPPREAVLLFVKQ